ncbi:MAG: carboxypeptidase regulatory-like domain-containing protein [Pirellulales bacterium]|nr:carboxypeptidase regulatory-like domain-containing protein [Pirellulales bacterium]
MKKARILTAVLVSLATAGLCAPPAVFATMPQETGVVDVALMDGGVLLGQVVNTQGTAVAKTSVVLRDGERPVAMPQTGEDGYFAVKGLRPGVYHVAVGQGQGTYRVWAPGTAPPNAHRGALIVTGDEIARGQFGGGGLSALLANPWVLAGIVATAVAVPVAIHNSNHSSPASP